ncbi:HEPN domain-containing protein [[Clostridium] scindens]|uniref:HEPN domain-containing protein n=1 Tax=Clostridium scindens (strain JCM 10418 / VPI 12708) TaxID=29347 RepID=UPI001D075349|nr:HEPN domain-containing protein [[Clostridium] scindens]MCB6285576.1 HEPN domain-containing protein [[Clostridium] scindens]MCB6420347.1 HEPN domain-containing protein [[Clostridium] scindens]MCB7192172.1 HEPN domain-containing protein [[Clostridium] scindens]MCB7285355.1 HEPN domain-containing protein [[Clostridium] scindens]MCG4929072.1 HEPN domain-containing protein [[Clostridium] scindens]
MQEAEDSLKAARYCLQENLYKDCINRSYYAAFYGVKAVLALGTVDFKRHKDVVAYFNQHYVASSIFSREIGRRLATLKQLREKSDYDDFYIASREQAERQLDSAGVIIKSICEYLTLQE